ncbi:MAG: Maf family protein [Gammaproteobacteria bacterium]|nr:nucleoside triphosphate pyrophosphatase [Gammaproteobacteria bacterium]
MSEPSAPMAGPVDLVLASTSPYRRELLTRLGLAFRTYAPDVDETPHPDEAPEALVKRLAQAKARAAAAACPGALIIGSDQVAILDGRILGKPGTHDNACTQLLHANGRTMRFAIGLALLNTVHDRMRAEVVPFQVVFRRLTHEQIEHYVARDEPYNCAGSFRSEGLGITLFERLEGDDPTALMGLPLIRLVRMLENEGVAVL